MSKKHPTGPEYLRMQRKAEIKKRKAKEEREKLRWFDANRDHPKTIAFRQTAEATAKAHIELESYKEAKRQRLTKKRLTVAMPAFAACFKLDSQHPAGLVAVTPGARVEKTGPTILKGRWKAYALGISHLARSVVTYLENPEPMIARNTIPAEMPRAWFTVKLPHSYDRIQGVPLEIEHYPPLGAFETGAGYVAIFICRTGQIIEHAQTFASALNKLKRPVRRVEIDSLEWNTQPDAP